MSDLENIKLKELIQSEREVLVADQERWKRMGSGAHLDDWMAYGPGLQIRRRLAMRLAYTNRPEGKGYVQRYNQLMQADGIDTRDKSAMKAFTDVLWLHDDAERLTILRELRDAMSPGERSRLNSPISARQRVTKILAARADGTEASVRVSPVTILKKQLNEKVREVAHLQEELASAQHKADQGSLFDLKKDEPEEIGRVIADTISEKHFGFICAAVKKRYQEKKQRKQTPAG